MAEPAGVYCAREMVPHSGIYVRILFKVNCQKTTDLRQPFATALSVVGGYLGADHEDVDLCSWCGGADDASMQMIKPALLRTGTGIRAASRGELTGKE